MIDMLGSATADRFSGGKHTGRKNGFTRFEMLIVVIGTSVLAAVLLERMRAYQEYAEKTAMEMTVMNMRSGLRLRIAELMTQDRTREVGKLLDENPIGWLDTPPPNYLGSLNNVKSGDIPPGNWYFDAARKELIYVPYRKMIFGAGFGGKKAMALQVTARVFPKVGGNSSRVEGIALTAIDR